VGSRIAQNSLEKLIPKSLVKPCLQTPVPHCCGAARLWSGNYGWRRQPGQEHEGAGHGAEGHPGGQGATIWSGAGLGKGASEKARDHLTRAMAPGRIFALKYFEREGPGGVSRFFHPYRNSKHTSKSVDASIGSISPPAGGALHRPPPTRVLLAVGNSGNPKKPIRGGEEVY
jgi:hypothetical protein